MADYRTDCMRFQAYAAAMNLTKSERLLWHRRRYIFETKDNPRTLPISNKEIRDAERLTDPTISQCRRELIRHKLIAWRFNDGGIGLYLMREVPDPDEVRYGLRERG